MNGSFKKYALVPYAQYIRDFAQCSNGSLSNGVDKQNSPHTTSNSGEIVPHAAPTSLPTAEGAPPDGEAPVAEGASPGGNAPAAEGAPPGGNASNSRPASQQLQERVNDIATAPSIAKEQRPQALAESSFVKEGGGGDDSKSREPSTSIAQGDSPLKKVKTEQKPVVKASDSSAAKKASSPRRSKRKHEPKHDSDHVYWLAG